MNNLLSFKAKTDYLPFYEVLDSKRVVLFGGSAKEAITFWQTNPSSFYLVVSNWVEEGEEAMMVGESVDITEVIRATIENCYNRWAK